MSQGTRVVVQLGALLAVAAAIGGYAYFGVFKKDQAQTEKKAIDERLFTTVKAGDKPVDGGVLKTEFTKLTVIAKGETTVIERSIGAPWLIVSPFKAEVDPLVIDALTSQLQQAKFKSTLEENPTEDDLKKYGLSPPEFMVEATAQVGPNGEPVSVKLTGGIENTFDGSVYMRRNEERPVYLAEGGVRWSLAKGSFDLRKKELASVDETQLKSLEVTAKANSYRLERNADKSWQLVKPFNALADSNTVNAMLGQLRGAKALSFVTEAMSRKRVALAVMTTTDDKTIRLDFGAPPADGVTSGYLLREDEHGSVLAEVKFENLGLLDRNPLDLRDKTIVTFKKELVTRMLFHNADGSEFTVEQEAVDGGAPIQAWRVTGLGPAKTFKVTAVIWLLSTIKGAAFVDEKGRDLSKLGLDAKGRYIALFGADGAELARFSIGKAVPDKPNIYFVRGTRPLIIEVDGARFTELPSMPADLLEGPPLDAGR